MDQIKIYYDLHSFVLEDLGQKEELKIITLRTPGVVYIVCKRPLSSSKTLRTTRLCG